jgi:hypothetical protein
MHRWYVLLAIPVIAMVWVPWYAGEAPALAGIPYFYWYQFGWIISGAVLTWIVYRATTPVPAESER